MTGKPDRITRKINGEADKLRSLNKKLTKKDARYMVLDAMFDDLPDGAYFAAMQEYGYESEDLIECNERVVALGFYK